MERKNDIKVFRDSVCNEWGLKDDVIYVFVLLNQPKQKADYFIATSEEDRAKVKQYETRGIIDLSSIIQTILEKDGISL